MLKVEIYEVKESKPKKLLRKIFPFLFLFLLLMPFALAEEIPTDDDCKIFSFHANKCVSYSISKYENEAIFDINNLIGEFLSGKINPISLGFLFDLVLGIISIFYKVAFGWLIVKMMFMSHSATQRKEFKESMTMLLLGTVLIFSADVIYNIIRQIPATIGTALINSVTTGELSNIVGFSFFSQLIGFIFVILLLFLLLLSILINFLVEFGLVLFPITLFCVFYLPLKKYGDILKSINIMLLLVPLVFDVLIFLVYYIGSLFPIELRTLVMSALTILGIIVSVKFPFLFITPILKAGSYMGVGSKTDANNLREIKQEKEAEITNQLLNQLVNQSEIQTKGIEYLNTTLTVNGKRAE